MTARDRYLDQRTCRSCGCHDLRACRGGCSWFAVDVETPSGVCTRCAYLLECNPVLVDTVGTDAMDDATQSIFGHLECARDWPPRPLIMVAA